MQALSLSQLIEKGVARGTPIVLWSDFFRSSLSTQRDTSEWRSLVALQLSEQSSWQVSYGEQHANNCSVFWSLTHSALFLYMLCRFIMSLPRSTSAESMNRYSHLTP